MEQQTAVIKAVCISEKRGEQKHPVEEIQLRPHLGILGDAHAGDWHRQVSLLSQESVDRLQEKTASGFFPALSRKIFSVRGSASTPSPWGPG